MSIDQIKEEIKGLSPDDLDEVASLILQLRRENDPHRKTKIGEMIDDSDVVSWQHTSSE